MEAGFTLVETLVTITVITILTFLTVTAFPAVRASQQVQNDIHNLRSLFAQAQQRALNEVRSDECVEEAGSEESGRNCSNVGVALLPNEFVLFADIDGNRRLSSRDVTFATFAHNSTIEAPRQNQLHAVFEAAPPTTYLYVDGNILGPSSSTQFALVSEPVRYELSLRQFGILDVQ